MALRVRGARRYHRDLGLRSWILRSWVLARLFGIGGTSGGRGGLRRHRGRFGRFGCDCFRGGALSAMLGTVCLVSMEDDVF